MTRKARFQLMGLVLVAVAIALQVIYGGTEITDKHAFIPTQHGFYIVDFALFILILVYFVGGPAKKFLQERHDTAKTEMTEAKSVLGNAQSRLSKYEARIAGVDEERAQIAEDFRNDGNTQKAKIEAEGIDLIAKIRADFGSRQTQEALKVEDELRHTIAVKALVLADEKIRGQMNLSRHRSLIKQYIADLKSIDSVDQFRGGKGVEG
jgi:F0F1-type ATP synthase membrane subunit b/b'